MDLFCNSSTVRAVTTLTVVLLATWAARVILQGVVVRRKFLKIRAKGIPIMEPYSMLLGHISVMAKLGKGLPSDAHRTILNIKIVENWKELFPSATECPPVIYLDLWPFMSVPFLMVISPELCSQLTQVTPQPRHPVFKWAQKPLTGGLDLLSMDPADHKLWRARLNPGFSTRNLTSHMPILVEEVGLFAKIIKDQAGDGGDWGQMSTLYGKAIALTFDVIARIATGLHTQEQTKGPGSLLMALRRLISLCKFNTLKNRLERITPSFRRQAFENAEIIRRILQPKVESRLEKFVDPRNGKTVVDLAVKEFGNQNLPHTDGLVAAIIANLKIFLFAGHDTTAQTLCWVYYEINKYPLILEKLRKEHDEVLGKNSEVASEVLLQSPHKLNELRYTSAVIKETLRLRTPAGTIREATPGFALIQNGVQYPTEGFVIQTAPAALHRHPDLWPRVTEFIPERFLASEDDLLRPVKNAFRPFELGSTRCIGEELAMMEIELALVFTLRELDLDFNYSLWDKIQGRADDVETQTINNERAYRAGEGMGCVKDDLPIRVRLRRT
ncbi:putative NAD(P)-binding domain-containing protein [Seiridium cardinale]